VEVLVGRAKGFGGGKLNERGRDTEW
jgi:hypothetical protein